MKSLFLSLLLALAAPYLYAQQQIDRDKLASVYAGCYVSKSIEELEQLLDSNFEIMGHKQPIASKILQSIISKFDTKVTRYELVGEEEKGVGRAITYDFYFEAPPQRKFTTIFTVTPEGKIREISIEGVGAKAAAASTQEVRQVDSLPNLITVPFFLPKSNLITVKAKIDGEERNFLFDSGAPFLVLNLAHYNAGDTTKGKKILGGDVKGVGGKVSEGDILKVKSFDFAGIRIENAAIPAFDLSNLENEGIPIHGIIGHSVFKDFDVMYDYGSKTITLIKKSYAPTFIASLAQTAKITEVPMRQENHIPYIDVLIGDATYKMGIDCGASVNLLSEAKKEELKPYTKRLKRTDLGGLGTSKNSRETGKVKELTIGSRRFKNVQTVFSDISHLNMQVDGLIGYPILSSRKCIVSYHTQRLIFID